MPPPEGTTARGLVRGSVCCCLPHHRLRSGIPRESRLPHHLRLLVETAWELTEQPLAEDLRLRLWAHTCGFRGHFLTKSQRYSVTFGALRAERQRWQVKQRPKVSGKDQLTVNLELHEWEYEGCGYLAPGDSCLALTVEEGYRAARYFERDGQYWHEGLLATDETAP